MNHNETGMVFDLQHFSISDGPGIRAVVFFKGCPLRCSWCHNPESYLFQPQVMAYQERCQHCGECAAVCPEGVGGMARLAGRDASPCTGCGKCADACMAGALEMAGRVRTVEQVLQEVTEDELFFRTSGGGMTLSGGEPMAQFDFALALAMGAKEQGIHVCMETSGHCATEKIMAIRPYVDLFLYDYKVTGSQEHRRHTGVGQELILKNLHALDESGAQIILRCPMIPGVNIHDAHKEGIIATAASLANLQQIHLEPYHNIGLSKRTRLGMDASGGMDVPDRAVLQAMAEEIQMQTGCETLVM